MEASEMDAPDRESSKTVAMRKQLQVVDAGELAHAYIQARYAVALDGDALALHVGHRAIDVEAYWPLKRYAFITAWNPASVPHSDTANETANAMLAARLDALGLPRQLAHAYDAHGQWCEPGWVVGDIEPPLIDLLGREFGQAGVLAWAFGEKVQLRMLLPRPGNAPDTEWIHWVG